jgi:thiol-disulfide isomerase/thioredoxin
MNSFSIKITKFKTLDSLFYNQFLIKKYKMFAELEQDNLAQVVADNNIVIVQYGAGWCGNCRLVKPKFKKLAAEYEGQAEFLYVDAEKLVESRKLADVPNLPTFAVFKGGENVGQVTASKIDAVKELINEAAGI